jgi:hypothetical protein
VLAIAGGVEHLGRHQMGQGVDPNPRFVAGRVVDTSTLVIGQTAENLHDRFPRLTRGWPFHLGGITPYLDREGISEQVTGGRFH